jgi:light-regulated signal transduction histidine kinase (bacteriophytochrome)
LDLTNKELEQFAYVTSHDLQEPLRMITSFMTMLESKYSHHLDDKAKLYINFAVDGAKRMRQLILDLLEYSRSGKNESEKEEVDLQDILHQTLLFNKRLMEEKQAQVKFTTLPKALAYRAPLTQVIQNLVENGIKYSKPDTPPRLEVSATDRGRDWLISIQDNGIGIPNEFHERVFIIFQRLHKKEDYKGTGIGLAVVKKQVESWGGKIWLESEPGVGTVFYFTIPK